MKFSRPELIIQVMTMCLPSFWYYLLLYEMKLGINGFAITSKITSVEQYTLDMSLVLNGLFFLVVTLLHEAYCYIIAFFSPDNYIVEATNPYA